MMWFLRMLFFGHAHKWKIIREAILADDIGQKGRRYTLQCESCGDVQCRDFL